jgi:hypothetical protein
MVYPPDHDVIVLTCGDQMKESLDDRMDIWRAIPTIVVPKSPVNITVAYPSANERDSSKPGDPSVIEYVPKNLQALETRRIP